MYPRYLQPSCGISRDSCADSMGSYQHAWGARLRRRETRRRFGNSPPEICHLKLGSKREAVIRPISWQNRNMLEMLWWVSYLCSDEPYFLSNYSETPVPIDSSRERDRKGFLYLSVTCQPMGRANNERQCCSSKAQHIFHSVADIM